MLALLARWAEVDANVATVELGAVLGFKRRDGVLDVRELNVTESLASATVAVRDDADAFQLAEFLKLACKPFLVDVPAEIADEEVGSSFLLLAVDGDLGLLGSLVNDCVGLALLALLLDDGLGVLFDLVFITVGRGSV